MGTRSDFNLMNFRTYSDYLKSFTKVEDYRYLSSMNVIRSLVKLGYSTNATVYEEEEFYKIKKHLYDLINPKAVTSKLFSQYLVGDDPLLVALAEREQWNVQKKLSTIIFLQIRQKNGFDISGYIDYADSLRNCAIHAFGATNWKAIFEGRILLRPNRTNLSFYDWHTGTVSFNNSDNFETMQYGTTLMFKHYGDHKIIPVTILESVHKDNVKRTLIESPLYDNVVLYDHIVRKAS
ncbi:cilia- and flagella-associated protein 299-like [Drosophila sulfurigaster albostrigata]|uniref:cilia- and flagella-associated protein 299-like n=1 Tax=Drosophila sulfurigaster albostrigata TaxID=89887 RepID=UPI002D218F8A|nr:cilia- and flagella-associated protein 299-like [Drosophila sulfurigaster albostrigata]